MVVLSFRSRFFVLRRRNTRFYFSSYSAQLRLRYVIITFKEYRCSSKTHFFLSTKMENWKSESPELSLYVLHNYFSKVVDKIKDKQEI